MVWGERFLDCLLLPRQEIEAKFIGKSNQVAPGLTGTFDILGNQLLDTGHAHGHHPLVLTLLQLDVLGERTLERCLEIGPIDFGLRLAPFGLPLCPGLN